jgi:hypothetical protein
MPSGALRAFFRPAPRTAHETFMGTVAGTHLAGTVQDAVPREGDHERAVRTAAPDGVRRGARHDDLHLSVTLANSGDVQIELIQQRCQTPSMYREFLAAGREGLQHWSSWPEDYEACLERT